MPNISPEAWALIAAAAIAFFSYVSAARGTLSTRLSERYYAILQLAITHPEFFDPKNTSKYAEKWEGKDLSAYDAIARLCWGHAEDVLESHFLIFIWRRTFRRSYSNAFELYRRVHLQWLQDNPTFFPKRSFNRFIDRCRWRDYVDARAADHLRWDNETAGEFERTVLDPLDTTPDKLGAYLATEPNKQTKTVADVGCGFGKLVKRLVGEGFHRVYAIDASASMLDATWGNLNNRERERVDRRHLDMRHMVHLNELFEVVFSLNSILPREPSDTPRILREIAASIKPGGTFVAILPAFDTVTALKECELPFFVDRRRRLGGPPSLWGIRNVLGRWDRWKAYHIKKRMSGWIGNSVGRLSLARFLWRKAFAHSIGPCLFADDGANLQRFIRKREIAVELNRAGLTIRSAYPTEVYYDWASALKCGYGNFADPNDPATHGVYETMPKIFDWFVIADKPSVLQDPHPSN